jgi:hypothetical protein
MKNVKNVTIMKKNTIFHFLKKKKPKKKDQKYILLLQKNFHFSFFIFLIIKEGKNWTFVGQNSWAFNISPKINYFYFR